MGLSRLGVYRGCPDQGVSLSREHPPWRRGHGSKQGRQCPAVGRLAQAVGPQGDGRPLHMAGRREKLGGVRRAGRVPEP